MEEYVIPHEETPETVRAINYYPIWLVGRFSPLFLDSEGNVICEPGRNVVLDNLSAASSTPDEEFEYMTESNARVIAEAFRLPAEDLPHSDVLRGKDDFSNDLTPTPRRCYGCGVKGLYAAPWNEAVFCASCREEPTND